MISVRGGKPPQIKINTTGSNGIAVNVNNVALDTMKLIRDRTSKGVDVNHAGFDDYSTGYKKYRQKKGKGTKVNMKFLGTMIEALTIAKKAVGWARVYIDDKERSRIGAYHQEGKGNMPERAWFGVNKADADKLYKRRFRNCKAGVFK